jgi:hypothetical protein
MELVLEYRHEDWSQAVNMPMLTLTAAMAENFTRKAKDTMWIDRLPNASEYLNLQDMISIEAKMETRNEAYSPP